MEFKISCTLKFPHRVDRYFTCLYYVYGHHIQIHISTTVQKKNNEWKKYAHWQKWKMGQKIYTIKPQISLLDNDIPIQISMHVPIHSFVNRKSLSCQVNSFKQSSDGHPHSFLLFIVITFFIITFKLITPSHYHYLMSSSSPEGLI